MDPASQVLERLCSSQVMAFCFPEGQRIRMLLSDNEPVRQKIASMMLDRKVAIDRVCFAFILFAQRHLGLKCGPGARKAFALLLSLDTVDDVDDDFVNEFIEIEKWIPSIPSPDSSSDDDEPRCTHVRTSEDWKGQLEEEISIAEAEWSHRRHSDA